jgi:hypothetical protein
MSQGTVVSAAGRTGSPALIVNSAAYGFKLDLWRTRNAKTERSTRSGRVAGPPGRQAESAHRAINRIS